VDTGKTRGRGRYGDVGLPIVAAALPTAAFQAPNLVGVPVARAVLVVAALVVFVGVVAWQVVRARRNSRARTRAEDTGAAALAAYEVAVQYGFGQIATRLTRFAALGVPERRAEVGAFADRAAAALAFYLLPHVPDVRANVYLLAPGLDALEPIGHGGAGDTAGVFRSGTPYGDRNLDWVLQGGPPRVVGDREADVDAEDDEPDFDPRYRSYVAVVVRGEGYSFGMLTVDARRPTPSPTSTCATSASWRSTSRWRARSRSRSAVSTPWPAGCRHGRRRRRDEHHAGAAPVRTRPGPPCRVGRRDDGRGLRGPGRGRRQPAAVARGRAGARRGAVRPPPLTGCRAFRTAAARVVAAAVRPARPTPAARR